MAKNRKGRKKKMSAKAVLKKFFRDAGRQLNKHAIRPLGRAMKRRAKSEMKRRAADAAARIEGY